MKSVLILEDNKEIADMVEKLLLEIDTNLCIYKESVLANGYQVAVEHNICLFIVDIMLDNSVRSDVSGLNFIEKIRTIEQYAFVPVVFMTSLVDPEIYAYRKLHCYGYLEKPLHIEETRQMLKQALKYQPAEKEEGTLYFRKDGVIFAVEKDEIVYVQSHIGIVTIKTIQDEVTVYYRTCKDILKALDSDRFLQSNRGTIINRDFIDHVDVVSRIVTLKENYGNIEIGTKYKKNFMERLNNG